MLCCLDLWGSFEATHGEPSQRLAEKWFTVIFGDISPYIEAFKQKLKLHSAELVTEDAHMGLILPYCERGIPNRNPTLQAKRREC